jgi:hypothetical protein
MRQMHVAVGMLACLLAGCADSPSTQLAPTGPQNVTIQSKPTQTYSPVLSTPGPCVTRVSWNGSGVATVQHAIELAGGGMLSIPPIKPDSPPRTSTVQWDPITVGSRGGASGRVRAILYDRQGNVLADTDLQDIGFVCGA